MPHPEPSQPPVPTAASARESAHEGHDRADVTGLIGAWGEGDAAAFDALVPIVYAELRRRARRALRAEAVGHTLQTTALVHEAYLRLARQAPPRCEDRAQFFRIAGRCMRQVLVDAARARRADKRGAGARIVRLSDSAMPAAGGARAEDEALAVLELDAALERLATIDPGLARLVELRYFAGLTIPDTAVALGVSPATVSREWAVARRWLQRELRR